MAHETHNDNAGKNQVGVSFQSSFWLIIILVGLFIASLNFIQVEGGHEGEGKKEGTEMHEGGKHEAANEEHAAKEEQKANNETEHNSVNGEPKPAAVIPEQPEHK